MNKYEFKLTPAYCLYNGTAIIDQKGSSIKFLMEKYWDESLKKRLTRAFCNYVNFVITQKDCPEEFRTLPAIEFFEGNRQQLKKCVSKLYGKNFSAVVNEQAETESIDSSSKNEKNGDDAAAVILLDSIMAEAKNKGATDIHIEENLIRFRINGKLETEFILEGNKTVELIQRIKMLAGMNVLEKRRSQDGHFVYGRKEPLFVRVSSMGIIGKNYSDENESVVIRILDTSRIPLNLENLGFNESQKLKILDLCNEKNGLIIICGPTGAGKSTTAASMLQEIKTINNGNVKIISLEDPPEYVIPGITQIQIDGKIKNSFSEALVHVFRQDPDVLMIGEIRDEKSASAAIRASLTGHLVIATLHTASASGAIMRLEDLGISRNAIVSVLKGVIIQEMNHSENKMNLLADISVPEEKLQMKIKEELSEKEINSCFSHLRNYVDLDEKGFVADTHGENIITPVFKTEDKNYRQLEG